MLARRRRAVAAARRGAPGVAARDRGAVEGRVELVLLELEPTAERPPRAAAPRQPLLSFDNAGRLAVEVGGLVRSRQLARGATRAGSRPRRRRGSGRGRVRARRGSGRRTCGRSSALSVGSVPMLPLEAVPNFSEGRDRATIDAIGEALSAHARLLDVHSDEDHNRSVYTLVGSEEELVSALLAGIACARERIDLRRHEGAHPHIGAADVVPLVPIREDDAERARVTALELARRVGNELALPVFLYADLAAGRGPAFFRRGGPAELQRRIDAGELAPDFGPTQLDERAGGVLIGARAPLIAFNVDLAGRRSRRCARGRACGARARRRLPGRPRARPPSPAGGTCAGEPQRRELAGVAVARGRGGCGGGGCGEGAFASLGPSSSGCCRRAPPSQRQARCSGSPASTRRTCWSCGSCRTSRRGSRRSRSCGQGDTAT